MDKEIREKYEKGLSPFNGAVISCTTDDNSFIPLNTLRELTKSREKITKLFNLQVNVNKPKEYFERIFV